MESSIPGATASSSSDGLPNGLFEGAAGQQGMEGTLENKSRDSNGEPHDHSVNERHLT